MRKIKIPDIQFSAPTSNGTVRQVSALEQLRLLVSMPPTREASFTIDDIRLRLPLVEMLEACEVDGQTEILLEDAQHALLVESIRVSTWSGVSRAALVLADAVTEAEEVAVKPSS